MRSSLALASALVVALLVCALERPGWLSLPPSLSPPSAGARLPRTASPSEGSSVTIFIVGESGMLEQLRSQIPRDRVLADRADAIAVAGGRIFATRIEAASGPLSELGWAGRSLEIVDPRRAAVPTSLASASDEAESGLAGLERLSSKPTLTLGETLAILQAESGGGRRPPHH